MYSDIVCVSQPSVCLPYNKFWKECGEKGTLLHACGNVN